MGLPMGFQFPRAGKVIGMCNASASSSLMFQFPRAGKVIAVPAPAKKETLVFQFPRAGKVIALHFMRCHTRKVSIP